jgi:hypothetical protein
MKKCLLTWYGITDLGAALGLNDQEGPVLAAIKNGDFDELRILAYTDSSKANIQNDSQEFDDFQKLSENSEAAKTLSREEFWSYIDLFSNTGKAHRKFKKWIKEKASELNLSVAITLQEEKLSSLNDTDGIYSAALDSLQAVCETGQDRQIFLHISPGTPLMAFSWGLLAIKHPHLDIRVISSSDYRKGFEQVQLPLALIKPEAHVGLTEVGNDLPDTFDVIFHLLGDQKLPALLGIQQFDCPHHVFVTSPRYYPDSFKQFLPDDAKVERLDVDPFDSLDVKLKIHDWISQNGPKCDFGFNLTGGTKLMYSGALDASQKLGGFAFYFETSKDEIVDLSSFNRFPSKKIEDVETFLRLEDYKVVKKGNWEDVNVREVRSDLTTFLWRNRAEVQKLYSRLSEVNKHKQTIFEVEDPAETVFASLDIDGNALLKISGKEFSFKEMPDWANYLCGQWLEEYSYQVLRKCVPENKLKDIRIGLEITWGFGGFIQKEAGAQEFDVILTDGHKLTIIECKAGKMIEASVIDKLQNCVQKYGGVTGRGILITAFPVKNDSARKKLNEAKSLSHCYGDDLEAALRQAL